MTFTLLFIFLPCGRSIPTNSTIFPFSLTNIAHFSIAKPIPISLLKSIRVAWTNMSNSSLLQLYKFKSSINKRWLIFSLLPENSYVALVFLKIKLNEINDQTNSKGVIKFPWKIPRLILTYFNFDLPAHNITAHFFKILTKKVIKFSVTPNKPKHPLIQECGTIA